MRKLLAILFLFPLLCFGQSKTPLLRPLLQSNGDGNQFAWTNLGGIRVVANSVQRPIFENSGDGYRIVPLNNLQGSSLTIGDSSGNTLPDYIPWIGLDWSTNETSFSIIDANGRGVAITATSNTLSTVGDFNFQTPQTMAGAVIRSTFTASPAIDVSQVWNNGATLFKGATFWFTNTASLSGSLLFEVGLGNQSYFKINRDSSITSFGPISASSFTGNGANITALNGTQVTSGTVPIARLGISLGSSFTTLTDGATITWTMDATKDVQNATVTLGGARTLAFSGVAAGMSGRLIVKQDGTGGRSLALPATSKVSPNGTGGVGLTSAGGSIDCLTFFYDGANIFWVADKNFN